MECDSLGLPHFAKLFQRQLVEVWLIYRLYLYLILGFIHVQNSRHGQKIDGTEESENTLVNNLKKSNPNKFLRYVLQCSK